MERRVGIKNSLGRRRVVQWTNSEVLHLRFVFRDAWIPRRIRGSAYIQLLGLG